MVFLGDSITDGNAYAGILADWYLTRFPERDIRFVNSGIPGDKAWLAARSDEMEDRVFSLNPSAVVVMFGMNDCRRFDFGPSPSDGQIAVRAKSLATFREATHRIATNILGGCGPVPLYLLSPHPWDDNSALPQGKTGAEARSPDFYGKGAAMGAYADAVRKVAEQTPARHSWMFTRPFRTTFARGVVRTLPRASRRTAPTPAATSICAWRLRYSTRRTPTAL